MNFLSWGLLVWSVPAFSPWRFSWRSLNWNSVINCTFHGLLERRTITLLLQHASWVKEINAKIHMWVSHQPFQLRDFIKNLQLYRASVFIPVVKQHRKKIMVWGSLHNFSRLSVTWIYSLFFFFLLVNITFWDTCNSNFLYFSAKRIPISQKSGPETFSLNTNQGVRKESLQLDHFSVQC